MMACWHQVVLVRLVGVPLLGCNTYGSESVWGGATTQAVGVQQSIADC
jgi:hypothetical protein